MHWALNKVDIVVFTVWAFLIPSNAQDIGTVDWLLPPKEVWRTEGGEVVLLLRLRDPQSSPTIAACSVEINGHRMNEGQDHSINSSHPDRVHIKRDLTGTGCNVTIENISQASSGTWLIEASLRWVDVHILLSDPISHRTTVKVLGTPIPLTQLNATIGHFETLNCKDSVMSGPHYCHILSNTNQLVSKDCSMTINPVKLEHIGNWTCVMALTGSMTELNHTISLVVQGQEYPESRVFQEGGRLVVECSLLLSKSRVTWCRAISPRGTNMLLFPGLANGRYSASQTNLEEKKCSMDIQLPLVELLDYGQWRLDVGTSADDYTGCFFTLPIDTDQGVERPQQASVSRVMVKQGDALGLRCEVPWPAAYCYVLRPDASLIHPSTGAAAGLLRVGVCSLTATNLTMEQTGRWTCGLPSNNGQEDILFYTDVEVYNAQLSATSGSATAMWGGELRLLCRSALRAPLRYCRFTSPQSQGYSLEPNTTSSSRFSYFGAGLEAGECGIKITQATSGDVGSWTCASTFSSRTSEEYAIITVVTLKPTLAFTLGMSFGAVIIGSVLIVLLVVRYRRKRAAAVEEGERAPTLSPYHRESDFPLYGVNIPTRRVVEGDD